MGSSKAAQGKMWQPVFPLGGTGSAGWASPGAGGGMGNPALF